MPFPQLRLQCQDRGRRLRLQGQGPVGANEKLHGSVDAGMKSSTLGAGSSETSTDAVSAASGPRRRACGCNAASGRARDARSRTPSSDILSPRGNTCIESLVDRASWHSPYQIC